MVLPASGSCAIQESGFASLDCKSVWDVPRGQWTDDLSPHSSIVLQLLGGQRESACLLHELRLFGPELLQLVPIRQELQQRGVWLGLSFRQRLLPAVETVLPRISGRAGGSPHFPGIS